MDRTDVQNCPTAVLDHVVSSALRAEEITPHVEIEKLIVDVFRKVEKPPCTRHTRVIHEYVQATEGSRRFVDDTATFADRAEITSYREGPPTSLLDFPCRNLCAFPAVGVMQDDCRSFCCQRASDPLPDTHASSRHEGPLPTQLPHRFSSFWTLYSAPHSIA
jgi:hypothetical protein